MSERKAATGPDEVLRAAAQWAVELSSAQISPRRIAQWREWLAASEAHQHAFDRIQSALRAIDSCAIDDLPWPTDGEVAGDAYDGSAPVAAWLASPSSPVGQHASRRNWSESLRRHRRALGLGLAACVVIALATPLALPLVRSIQFGPAVTIVETRSGENRQVPLGDGSTVSVGARTVLWATLSRDARTVTLERGEAFFAVAKDARRPFTVKVGNTTVAAVGTAFNVRRAGRRIVVAVAEGLVDVEAAAATQTASPSGPQRAVVRTAQLSMGQQLSIDAVDGRATLQTVAADSIGAWREGRLQYRDEPLQAVVADVMRYSGREIVIADAAVADLRVTGAVFANDVESWLDSLEAALPVRTIRAPDGAVRLESRSRDAPGD